MTKEQILAKQRADLAVAKFIEEITAVPFRNHRA